MSNHKYIQLRALREKSPQGLYLMRLGSLTQYRYPLVGVIKSIKDNSIHHWSDGIYDTSNEVMSHTNMVHYKINEKQRME